MNTATCQSILHPLLYGTIGQTRGQGNEDHISHTWLVYTHSFTGLTQYAILNQFSQQKQKAKQTMVLFKVSLIQAYLKQIRNRLNLRSLLDHSTLSFGLKVKIHM